MGGGLLGFVVWGCGGWVFVFVGCVGVYCGGVGVCGWLGVEGGGGEECGVGVEGGVWGGFGRVLVCGGVVCWGEVLGGGGGGGGGGGVMLGGRSVM